MKKQRKSDNFVMLDSRGWVVFKENDVNINTVVRKFDYGFLPVVNENGGNYIDKSGNLMFPKWTKDMIEVLPEGIIRIGLDNYVDCNGEIVLCV